MKNVKKWLSDPNRQYTDGVKLYAQFGQNGTLKHSFSKGENELRRAVLDYELSKIAGVEAIEQAPDPEGEIKPLQKVPTPTVESIVNTMAKELGEFPNELIDLIRKRGHLTNKKAIVHNKMLELPKEAVNERAMAMAEMAAIRKEIEDITDIEKHYITTGKMPEAKAETTKKDDLNSPIPTDKADLLQLKKSLSERKSKANKKLKTLPEKHPNRVAIEDKIARIDVKAKEVDAALQSN